MILDNSSIEKTIKDLKRQGKTIVFTNGCFDILHIGHVRYLKEAKSLGDILVVGLNSDESIRYIKGPKRPIIPQEERAEILASIRYVDYVVIFNEPDPYNLISLVKPHILVKGGDWPVEKIVGKDIVEGYGGKVLSIPYMEGSSTTGIITKILERYGKK